MRRDSLFYRLFRQSPTLLFELLDSPPSNAAAYRFDSVAVKEPKFEIDGVFLPPEGSTTGTVYFCEVQFQKDDQLYERLFGESFLYFYRQRHRFSDWQAVVIYPSRSIEQSLLHPYRALLSSEQVHRIFLNELGEPQELPLNLGLMVLTTVTAEQAPVQARALLARTQAEVDDSQNQRAIIDLITTIMVYRFERMSRQEVEAMLGLQLEDTRVYREAKEEGIQEGRQEGRERQANLLLKQLQHKLGDVPAALVQVIRELDFGELEQLGEAIFDLESFTQVTEQLMIRVNPQTAVALVQPGMVLRLIEGCLGQLAPQVQTRVTQLSVSQVSALASVIFEWQSQADLEDWLATH